MTKLKLFYVTIITSLLSSNSFALGSNQKKKQSCSDVNIVKVESKAIFPTEGLVVSSPAIMIDQTVVIGSNDGNVYFLNPDGTEKDRFPTMGAVRSSPAIMKDGTVVIVSDDGYVYFVDPDGAKKIADFDLKIKEDYMLRAEGGLKSSPRIMKDEKTIVVASYDGPVYFLNPDGTEKARFSNIAHKGNKGIYHHYFISSPTIMNDGTVVISSYNGNIYFLNPDGTEKAQFPTHDRVFSTAAIMKGDKVVVGSFDGNVYFLNPDGTEKARFPYGRIGRAVYMISSPAIMKDETVVVGAEDGIVYFLNPDGTEKARFPIPTKAAVSSSPAIMRDGTVVIGAEDGNVYFLKSKVEKSCQPTQKRILPNAKNGPKRGVNWEIRRKARRGGKANKEGSGISTD